MTVLKKKENDFDYLCILLNNKYLNCNIRFEISRKLGQGTYGKVQLGINKETGQQVRKMNQFYFSRLE